MTCTAAQLLRYAKSQVGYKEKPAGSNMTKYGKWYGLNGQPWCAIFLWACFYKCNASELYFGGKKTAYCPALADYYIKQKRIVKKLNGKPGDIVFFDFNKNGTSDHVGLIVKYLGNGYYRTLEGNTGIGNNTNGGEVMYRKRHTSQISRIARPVYKKVKAKKKTAYNGSDKASKVDLSKYPQLKLGSKGKYVKIAQKLLGVKQDGVYGKITESAVKKYQKRQGLTVDGVIGKKTWAKLLK